MQFQPVTHQELLEFSRSAEAGRLDHAALDRLLKTLAHTPHLLLPGSLGALQEAAFFTYKLARLGFALDILYFCLRWTLNQRSLQENAAAVTENIAHILGAVGVPLSADDIAWRAFSGQFGHTELWAYEEETLPQPTEVREFDGSELKASRMRFGSGFRAAVSSATIPLSEFRGWRKRLDPDVLNDIGRHVVRNVFPLFGGNSSEEFTRQLRRLADCGVALSEDDWSDYRNLQQMEAAGLRVDIRRHRRFAGGDGLLSRGCYASICKDSRGDDEGTMSRELMAYVDHRIPGLVYVGDSTSRALMDILATEIGVRDGYCATIVLLFAPTDRAHLQAYRSVYADVLGDAPDVPVRAFAFETRVEECVIQDVIDLRLPETQQWFFDHFCDGDGHFLVKDGGSASDFHDMLPALMDPSLGGSATTHAIGSWMRSSGVNGLIFPSARSDASVTVEDGEMVHFHGWNLIDYRATARTATETVRDPHGWPDFASPGVSLGTVDAGPYRSSWRVSGVEERYAALRSQIEGEDAAEEADSGAAHLSPEPNSSVIEKCTLCGAVSTWTSLTERPPRRCWQCGHETPRSVPDIGPSS